MANTRALLEHVLALLARLSALLTHPAMKTWTSPAQYSPDGAGHPLLGTSRLRILCLVESLVLLGDQSVDAHLEESDVLEALLDLFWRFEWCSMLHQLAANLLVHVIKGGPERHGLQRYFLVRCNLLERLMGAFDAEGELSCSRNCKWLWRRAVTVVAEETNSEIGGRGSPWSVMVTMQCWHGRGCYCFFD